MDVEHQRMVRLRLLFWWFSDMKDLHQHSSYAATSHLKAYRFNIAYLLFARC